MQKNKIVWLVIGVVIIVGVAFYSGMKYGQGSNDSQFGSGNFSQRLASSTRGAGNTRAFGGMVTGQILSADANSITISTQGGGSRIVFLSASTTVAKMTVGTIGDLVTGTNVSVNGTANADNSLNAQMIQIRPAGVLPKIQ